MILYPTNKQIHSVYTHTIETMDLEVISKPDKTVNKGSKINEKIKLVHSFSS